MAELKPHAEAEKRFKLFADEMLQDHQNKIHSLHITGSCLTDDYDPKHSDINSICVLNKMELQFLEVLAPLGKKYGKKRVSAPLIMTPAYVAQSLDVFPIEFLNIKMIHNTWWGEDIFANIAIKQSDLRHQCERELKVKLIGLRQGYLSATGDRKILTANFVDSFAGYIPLFRGIIVLSGKEAPIPNAEVLKILAAATGVEVNPFADLLKEKQDRARLTMERLNTLFEACYAVIEKLGNLVDTLET